jgi:hypothetical protein
MDIPKLRESEYKYIHRDILEYYKGILPDISNTKLYSFSLKKGSNIYGIIFGSKHPSGVDKFLKIAWKKNKLNGEANFDIYKDRFKHSNQLVLFPWMQNLTKIEKFGKELGEFLLEEDRTNKEVCDFTLEHGHIPIHARIVVKKMKIENKIIYNGGCCISYDKCYNHNNREIKIFKRVV